MDKKLLNEIIHRYETANFTVNRIMNAVIRGQMPENLTADQYATLRYIRDRGMCTSSELADFFFVGKSSVTAMVTRLCDKGLIQRHPDEKDRRVIYLSLTEEGGQLVEEMYEKVEEMLAKYLTHFNDQEAQTFIRTFEKLANLLVEDEGGQVKA